MDIVKEAAIIKAKLPAMPQRPRKNLFDILKIQHREIRNTNILAYFFDPYEDHEFGTLFFDSLQQIAVEKVKKYKSMSPSLLFNNIDEFDEILTVNTEEQTKGAKTKTKSIDIVLEGDEWVIGIENKIYHHLNNPINTYWAHLKSKGKTPFGILLTLHPYKLNSGKLNDDYYFLNITHKELVERIQENIQLTGDLKHTDIFYLQEYFKNIESHYYHLKHKPEMNSIVQAITDNYKTINEIIKKKEVAEKYIENQINLLFSEFGYVKASKWYRREDKKFDLYFYIPPSSELMRTNTLWLCFEIRNQTNKTIDRSEFINYFQARFSGLKFFEQSELESSNQRTHAFIYKMDGFFEEENPFDVKFKKVLDMLINAKNSPVKQVEEFLMNRNSHVTGN